MALGGFFGGLVDSLTGKGARKDIDRGIGVVQGNTDKAVDAYKQYGDQARGELATYRDNGARGFEAFADSTGANGVDKANAAYQSWLQSNPLQAKLALDQKHNNQAFNSRGGYATPLNALSNDRIAMENWQTGYQAPLERLGQYGQKAATDTSQIDMGQGAGIAGAYGQGSNAIANLYGQRAQTENTFAQNLLGAGGTIARYFGYGSNDLGRRGSSGAGGP